MRPVVGDRNKTAAQNKGLSFPITYFTVSRRSSDRGASRGYSVHMLPSCSAGRISSPSSLRRLGIGELAARARHQPLRHHHGLEVLIDGRAGHRTRSERNSIRTSAARRQDQVGGYTTRCSVPVLVSSAADAGAPRSEWRRAWAGCCHAAIGIRHAPPTASGQSSGSFSVHANDAGRG